MGYPFVGSILDHGRLNTIKAAIKEADANGVPGALAEFGILRGGTARMMSAASPQRRLFVFDTFAGLPCPDPQHDARLEQGQFAATLSEAAPLLTDLPVTIVTGAFPESAIGIDPLLAVVHLDMDLYAPTAAALAWCAPRMASDGVIVLDDLTNRETPGIRRAIEESGHAFEIVGMQAVIRVRQTLGRTQT